MRGTSESLTILFALAVCALAGWGWVLLGEAFIRAWKEGKR